MAHHDEMILELFGSEISDSEEEKTNAAQQGKGPAPPAQEERMRDPIRGAPRAGTTVQRGDQDQARKIAIFLATPPPPPRRAKEPLPTRTTPQPRPRPATPRPEPATTPPRAKPRIRSVVVVRPPDQGRSRPPVSTGSPARQNNSRDTRPIPATRTSQPPAKYSQQRREHCSRPGRPPTPTPQLQPRPETPPPGWCEPAAPTPPPAPLQTGTTGPPIPAVAFTKRTPALDPVRVTLPDGTTTHVPHHAATVTRRYRVRTKTGKWVLRFNRDGKLLTSRQMSPSAT